jgi:hypothetical protein
LIFRVKIGEGLTGPMQKPHVLAEVAAGIAHHDVQRQRPSLNRAERLVQLRIEGNPFASVPRNARGCGVVRVAERCFSR